MVVLERHVLYSAWQAWVVYMPNILRTAERAYGIYDSVYQVYARYCMMTKTAWDGVSPYAFRRGTYSMVLTYWCIGSIRAEEKSRRTEDEHFNERSKVERGRGHTSLLITKAPTNTSPMDPKKMTVATIRTGLNIYIQITPINFPMRQTSVQI